MGRAGGSGGGGSRGGSFGGSRGGSFGGGSSRSSFGRSSYSSRSSRSYSRPYYGGVRTGPIIINNSGNNNSGSGSNGGPYNKLGCLNTILIVVMILSIIFMFFNFTLYSISKNRVQRVPLNSSDIVETDYYTDELNWINNPSVLKKGMKEFYKKTGVQPYLYITDNIGTGSYATNDEIIAFADNKYNELFKDESHILVIFYEKNESYRTYALSGVNANAVIDGDARSILLKKIDEYYFDSSLEDEEYFSQAFSTASNIIMSKPPTLIGSISVPFIFFIGSIAILIAIKKKQKQEKKDKELKEMLDKELDTFGDTEVENLAKKYETKTEDNNKI